MINKLSSFTENLLSLGVTLGFSFALFYTIFSNLRKRYKLKFTLGWSSGAKFYKKDKHTYATWTFSGLLKNQSLDPNCLIRIYLVVWRDKKRNSVLRFGYGDVSIKEEKKSVKLPLRLKPREAKNINVSFDFIVSGTSDRKILESANKPVGWVSRNWLEDFLLTRKFRKKRTGYELAFEDVNENLFDQYGRLRNRKEIDLWWALSNYKGIRRLRQLGKIYLLKILFFLKVFLRNIGLFS